MWSFWVSAAMAVPVPCGTLHPDALVTRQPAPQVAFGEADLSDPSSWSERDAWDPWPHALASDHFVLKWGSQTSLPLGRADGILAALEASWTHYAEVLDHRAPNGGVPVRFNVYLAGTGRSAPEEIGAAAYFTTDPDGDPMIVVEPSAWTSGGPYLDAVLAHELYHAVQWATGAYGYVEGAGWFWEASANWAAGEVYPGNASVADFLPAYLLLTTLPVDYWVYVEQGALEEYYAYGAYLFPSYLGWELDPGVVRDAWEEATTDDPLESLRAAVAERGADLDELWLDHIAANVHLDYPEGRAYDDATDDWARAWGNDQRITGELPDTGTPDGLGPPRAERPGRYGSNAWYLRWPRTDRVTLRVEGKPEGDAGSPARFGARVVVRDLEGLHYTDVPFDGLVGEVEITGLDRNTEEVVLVVGAWTPNKYLFRWPDETFRYKVFATVPAPEVVEEAPAAPEGCGCAQGGGTIPPWGWLAGLTLWVGRRKSRRHVPLEVQAQMR